MYEVCELLYIVRLRARSLIRWRAGWRSSIGRARPCGSRAFGAVGGYLALAAEIVQGALAVACVVAGFAYGEDVLGVDVQQGFEPLKPFVELLECYHLSVLLPAYYPHCYDNEDYPWVEGEADEVECVASEDRTEEEDADECEDGGETYGLHYLE